MVLKRLTSKTSQASKSSGSDGSQQLVISPRSDSTTATSEESGNYSLEGLANALDNSVVIRDRMREGHPLLRHYDVKAKQEVDVDQYVEKTTANCRVNQPVLTPVLRIMKENNMSPPCIDNVIYECDLFYKKCKSIMGNGERYYQDAWAIRRLCTYIKSFTYKPYQPKEPLVCITRYVHWSGFPFIHYTQCCWCDIP